MLRALVVAALLAGVFKRLSEVVINSLLYSALDRDKVRGAYIDWAVKRVAWSVILWGVSVVALSVLAGYVAAGGFQQI